MKQKNILQEQKAITLIALVITVVVMLILAGVTINLTLGERTDACMRVYGHANSLLTFTCTNPKGFHIRFENEDGEFISRVTGYRLGNTVILNQLRLSLDNNITNADIENLKALDIYVRNLEGDYGDFKQLTADNLEATNATIDELKAKDAEFEKASANYLTADHAVIEELKAKDAEFEKAHADFLTADSAVIEELKTDKLDADSAKILFAEIDFANIGEAAIKRLFSDFGLIEELVVSEGHITGELVGVTIRGDRIIGNTIQADKLVVKGEDGLFYTLNVNGETVETEQTDENSLNGKVITAKSITAEKIRVEDLVAFGATIGGFKITDSSIYSGAKASVDNTTTGVYLDRDGQIAFGGPDNYVKYYKNPEGAYILEIEVDRFKLAASDKDLSEELLDVRSEIEATEQSITSSVYSKEYINGQLAEIGTKIEQTKEDITLNFDTLSEAQKMIQENVDTLNDNTNANFEEIRSYIKFKDGNIILGKTSSPFTVEITNEEIAFKESGSTVAYINNSKLYITEGQFNVAAKIGNFAFVPRANGSLDFKKVSN